jgi:2-methylcitrate dehydratase PrpD
LRVGWEDGVVTARALSAALRAGRGIVGVGSGWKFDGSWRIREDWGRLERHLFWEEQVGTNA